MTITGWVGKPWDVVDPDAPAAAAAVSDAERSDAAVEATRPWSSYLPSGKFTTMCAIAVGIAAYGNSVRDMYVSVSDPWTVVLWLTLGLFTARLAGGLLLVAGLRRGGRRRLADGALRDRWVADHRIERDALAGDPMLRTADRIVADRNELVATRAARDGWIDRDWLAAINRRVWLLMVQLRDTRQLRDDVAHAADSGRPDLADAASPHEPELRALRDTAKRLRTELAELSAAAKHLDKALADQDQRRADDDAAAEVRARLTGTTIVADGHAAVTAARAELAAVDGTGNLRVLVAGLDAATRHVAASH